MSGKNNQRAKAAAAADARPGLAGELEAERGWLLGLMTRLTGDSTAAGDIVQEAFLKALASGGPGEGTKLRGWLAAVALNCARDQARKAERARRAMRAGAGSDWQEGAGPNPLEALLEAEMRDCIAEFVDKLPERQRRAVALHDLMGVSPAETARRLGVSQANARVLLHRGRKRLGELLGEACELDFAGDAVPCARKPAR